MLEQDGTDSSSSNHALLKNAQFEFVNIMGNPLLKLMSVSAVLIQDL